MSHVKLLMKSQQGRACYGGKILLVSKHSFTGMFSMGETFDHPEKAFWVVTSMNEDQSLMKTLILEVVHLKLLIMLVKDEKSAHFLSIHPSIFNC